MKNLMTLLTGVLLVSTLFLGFDKSEDEKSLKDNYLKVGDQVFDLSAGILENYGTDYDNSWHYGSNTDLFLYSEGLSIQIIDSDGYEDWDLDGIGHAIYFEMFSSTGNALDDGDYTISFLEPFPIGTIDASNYSINFDTENIDSAVSKEIVSGKVSVTKIGEEYSITINCTDEDGEKITGFYKGTLRFFDIE
jgi:hypothetical protein